MTEFTEKTAMLIDAKSIVDEACTGFDRLRVILSVIKRLATGSDTEIAELAGVGADLAEEALREVRKSADEFDELLTNAEDMQ